LCNIFKASQRHDFRVFLWANPATTSLNALAHLPQLHRIWGAHSAGGHEGELREAMAVCNQQGIATRLRQNITQHIWKVAPAVRRIECTLDGFAVEVQHVAGGGASVYS
jgi:hypothetical protein